jgi:serine phosphatase RsbU (regulator of sigma subunit)
MRSEARKDMLIWGTIIAGSAVILGLSAWVILAWVVGPLERMRTAMLELANDNLRAPLPKPSRIKEIGAMDDALRVFKAGASRRQALQRERLKLHGRLEETYAHLKTDLEAAAIIQASLLPQKAQLAGISLFSYFRPSHFLAGDTFDVLQQQDGRVVVFQIDVAGHGAAAALVSVASKYTVAQAILQRTRGADLAEVVQEINREWSSDLPYFTLLLAEIDPATGEGTLVQAGHPSPILLRDNGELLVLGDGGLPIGALSQATFDTVPFSFGLNDRLVITTDGVHEMEDVEGKPFSEERLRDLLLVAVKRSTEQIIADLDAAMRSWRGNDTLDDDVTIVVLEGGRSHEDY